MSKLTEFAQAVGNDVKTININIGTISGLSTVAKDNLVAAINELVTKLQNLQAGSGGLSETQVDGKISAAISAFESKITGGALAAELDTLKEIADKIGEIVTKDSAQDALLLTLNGLSSRVQALEAVEAVDYLQTYKTAKGV